MNFSERYYFGQEDFWAPENDVKCKVILSDLILRAGIFKIWTKRKIKSYL